MSVKYYYRVPRSFKLREELDMAEKGTGIPQNDPNKGYVTFGIEDVSKRGFYGRGLYENQLANWVATIIGPQGTPLGERFYSLTVMCPPTYPQTPPRIRFQNKIIFGPGTVVDSQGYVQKISGFSWHQGQSMYSMLCALRYAMGAASKIKQPSDSDTYHN
jgi:ubiquitin-conjugating enzyme E2 variant